MKRLLAMLLILTMALGLMACGPKDPKAKENAQGTTGDPVIATVEGVKITLPTFQKTYAIVERNYIETYGEAIFSQEYSGKTLGELIKIEILNNLILDVLKIKSVKDAGKTVPVEQIQEAYTKYYDSELKDDEVKRTFYKDNGIDEAFIKSQIESQLYAQLYMENLKAASAEALTIDDATFESTVAKVSARHILVATQEEADAIVEKIKKGEAFEELAKTLSTDKASGELGGDLGFFMRGDMVDEFANVAFALPVGEVSAPVKSQFGFHIIRVDKIQTVADLRKENAKAEEIDKVKANMTDQLLQTTYQKAIEELLAKSKIERFEDLLVTPVKTTEKSTEKAPETTTAKP